MHTKIYDSTESIFDFPVGYETESGVFETPPFFGGNDTLPRCTAKIWGLTEHFFLVFEGNYFDTFSRMRR